MKKLFGKAVWFAILLVAGYSVLYFVAPQQAQKVADLVGIPPEWNEKLAALKASLDGTASGLSASTDGLTLSGVTQAVLDANSKVRPLVEQAVGTAQQLLSGASAVQSNIVSTVSGAQAAVQEKRAQIDAAAQAVNRVIGDVQDLQNKAAALGAKPSVYATGAAASGVVK